MIVGDPQGAVWRKTSSVNIRARRGLTAIHTVIPFIGTTLGSIAITGTATLGKRRVGVGAVDTALGMATTAAMTAGDASRGGTAIVIRRTQDV
jgi:hypothetical protein